MRLKYLLVVAAAFALAPIAGQTEGITLFSYPGSDRTALNGINDRGIALGVASIFPSIYKFKWNVRTGELTLLDGPVSQEEFGVEGINNQGVIVGGHYASNITVGFALQLNGEVSFYKNDSRPYTWGMAINEAGVIAGSHGDSAFIYKPGSNATLAFLPSPMASSNGINRWGKVVGHVLVPADEDTCGGGPEGATFIQYGFVRHQDGFITLFQVNGQPTYAGDIRDDGLIVGSVFDPVVNNNRIFTARARKEPCVFLKRARSTLIGKAGFEYIPRGINDNGRIVGTAIQRVGVDESVSYGFVTKVPAP